MKIKNHSLGLENHIQSIRAFSVVIVFLYHTNLDFFSFGYLGVDIFFLISGYVISKKIFEEYETSEKINLLNFYKKRIKRITPNLFFIISITFLFYNLFGPPESFLFSETIFALFGLSNLYYLNYTRDYFQNVFEDPLGHTWSLGVEEQFYIVFPILIYFFLNKKNNYNNLIIFLSIVLIISLFLFSYNFKSNSNLSFYFSPFRFWEFLLGTFFYLKRKKIKFNKFIFNLNILLILFLVFGNHNINFGFFLNIIILLLSGYVISAYKKNIFFENEKLVYLGNISYSFYLWHLPILFFSDLYITNYLKINLFVSFILTIVFSIFTYKWIEQKFRYVNWRPVYFINIVFVGFISLSFLIYIKYFNNDFKFKLKHFAHELNYLQKNYNWKNRVLLEENLRINKRRVYDYCIEESQVFNLNSYGFRKECLQQKNFKKIFFLFGNSHSAHFLPLLINNKFIDNVYFLHLGNYKFPDARTVNKLIKLYEEVYFITNIDSEKHFENITESYKKYSNSKTKLMLFNSTPQPNRKEPFRCFVQRKNCFIEKNETINKREINNLFKILEKYRIQNLNDFIIFNSFDFLCKNNKCPIYLKQSDILFYRDQSHLTYEGARTLLENFNQLLIDKKLVE